MLNFFFKDAIERRVDERLNELLSGATTFHFINIDDKSAEKIIADFIVERQKQNNMQLSVYDFVANLRLPAPQIENILQKFEKKNLVHEVSYA